MFDNLTDREKEDLQDLRDIARCFGMALYMTIRTAVDHANPNLHMPHETGTDLLVEGWINFIDKVMVFAAKTG